MQLREVKSVEQTARAVGRTTASWQSKHRVGVRERISDSTGIPAVNEEQSAERVAHRAAFVMARTAHKSVEQAARAVGRTTASWQPKPLRWNQKHAAEIPAEGDDEGCAEGAAKERNGIYDKVGGGSRRDRRPAATAGRNGFKSNVGIWRPRFLAVEEDGKSAQDSLEAFRSTQQIVQQATAQVVQQATQQVVQQAQAQSVATMSDEQRAALEAKELHLTGTIGGPGDRGLCPVEPPGGVEADGTDGHEGHGGCDGMSGRDGLHGADIYIDQGSSASADGSRGWHAVGGAAGADGTDGARGSRRHARTAGRAEAVDGPLGSECAEGGHCCDEGGNVHRPCGSDGATGSSSLAGGRLESADGAACLAMVEEHQRELATVEEHQRESPVAAVAADEYFAEGRVATLRRDIK